MIRTFILSVAVLVVLPLLAARPGRRAAAGFFGRFAPILAAHYFAFLALSAVMYKVVPYGWWKLTVAAVGAAAIAYIVGRQLPVVGQAPSPRVRATIVIVLLALLSVVGDAFIFSRQGFFLEDRTSLFAAAFAGDIQRDTDLIGGLLRGSQSVFFPRSYFIYQVLWHHGAANLVSVMPTHFTLFPYILGVTLATGFLFYVMMYWLVAILRPVVLGSPVALGVVVALAASDGDLYNAMFSLLRDGHVALAADASTRVGSAFRYFSNKLTTLSAPQHATFFILFSVVVALTYEPRIAGWGMRIWRRRQFWAIVAFTAACVAANPILSALLLSVYWTILIGKWWLQGRNVQEVITSGVLAASVGFVAHFLVLRFSPDALFLRPNITGGGSGVYGVHFPWTYRERGELVRHLPWVFIENAGIIGAVVFGVVLWAILRRRWLLLDTVVLTIVVGTLLWDVAISETEIQRHFAMIAAYLGVVVIATILPTPAWRRSTQLIVFIVPALLAIVLNGYLTRAYGTGGSILDPAIPWTDYYCMNGIIASRYPGTPVIVRTPDAFELPIAAEATTALVWSQVAFVHQKVSNAKARTLDEINSRNRQSFRRAILNDPEGTLRKLERLGYRAVIWGPVEEREWGPEVRQVLLRPKSFLTSCGQVGLYALAGSRGHDRGKGSSNAGHENFIRELLGRQEWLCSSGSRASVSIVAQSASHPIWATNWAIGRAATSSSSIRGGDAEHAVDGRVELGGRPSPLAHTGYEMSAWWQVDLAAVRAIETVEIWNRMDCCAEGLRAFYVLVSEAPIASSELYPACSQPGVSTFFVPTEVGQTFVVPVSRFGRYVRVQRLYPGPLALAEVAVWGGWRDQAQGKSLSHR